MQYFLLFIRYNLNVVYVVQTCLIFLDRFVIVKVGNTGTIIKAVKYVDKQDRMVVCRAKTIVEIQPWKVAQTKYSIIFLQYKWNLKENSYKKLMILFVKQLQNQQMMRFRWLKSFVRDLCMGSSDNRLKMKPNHLIR